MSIFVRKKKKKKNYIFRDGTSTRRDDTPLKV